MTIAAAAAAFVWGLGPIGPARADGAGGPAALYLEPGSVGPPGGGTRVEVKRSHTTTTVTRGGGHLTLDGAYAIPAIANDGSATGLSASGKTLVLRKIVPFGPSGRPSHSAFAIASVDRMRIERTFALPGQFSVDAVSPGGSRIYLIEYGRRTVDRRLAKTPGLRCKVEILG